MNIAQCPCCQSYYPCPANWGWAGKLVCVECETSLAIDPAYPFLTETDSSAFEGIPAFDLRAFKENAKSVDREEPKVFGITDDEPPQVVHLQDVKIPKLKPYCEETDN